MDTLRRTDEVEAALADARQREIEAQRALLRQDAKDVPAARWGRRLTAHNTTNHYDQMILRKVRGA